MLQTREIIIFKYFTFSPVFTEEGAHVERDDNRQVRVVSFSDWENTGNYRETRTMRRQGKKRSFKWCKEVRLCFEILRLKSKSWTPTLAR